MRILKNLVSRIVILVRRKSNSIQPQLPHLNKCAKFLHFWLGNETRTASRSKSIGFSILWWLCEHLWIQFCFKNSKFKCALQSTGVALTTEVNFKRNIMPVAWYIIWVPFKKLFRSVSIIFFFLEWAWRDLRKKNMHTLDEVKCKSLKILANVLHLMAILQDCGPKFKLY